MLHHILIVVAVVSSTVGILQIIGNGMSWCILWILYYIISGPDRITLNLKHENEKIDLTFQQKRVAAY